MENKIYFITVVNDYSMYDAYFKNNAFLQKSSVVLKDFDNTKENKFISVRYNEFLNSYDYSNEAWFVFCHSDWELQEEFEKIAEIFDKNKIYGPLGAGKRVFKNKFVRLNQGYCINISRDETQNNVYDFISDDAIVETLDCMCLVVHSSLVKKYNLRFDEKLEYDLYAEDFCVNSKLEYNINTEVFRIKNIHHTDSAFRNSPKSFYNMLEYFNKKYPKEVFASTAIMIGGGEQTNFGNEIDEKFYLIQLKRKLNNERKI